MGSVVKFTLRPKHVQTVFFNTTGSSFHTTYLARARGEAIQEVFQVRAECDSPGCNVRQSAPIVQKTELFCLAAYCHLDARQLRAICCIMCSDAQSVSGPSVDQDEFQRNNVVLPATRS